MPNSPEPEHQKVREVEGEPKAQYYAVSPEAVRNLAGFLKATGWTCLYGIGMGTNTPERAAEEAVFVAKTLDGSLQYFQIGNEVDLFGRHLRDPRTWSPIHRLRLHHLHVTRDWDLCRTAAGRARATRAQRPADRGDGVTHITGYAPECSAWGIGAGGVLSSNATAFWCE
jgi:hypothetical protein